MGKEIVGVNLNSLVIVGKRSVKVVDVIPRQRPVYIVGNSCRLQMYCLRQLLVSIFPLALRQTYHRPVRPRIPVVRIKFKTLVKILCSANRVFLLHADLGFKRISLRIGLPHGHHRVQVRVGSVIILLLYLAKHTVKPQALVIGIEFYRLIIISYCFVKLVLPDKAQATKLEQVGNIRIQPYRLRAVFFSSDIIIKVKLGDGAQEPRLVQIRLDQYYLVEILD